MSIRAALAGSLQTPNSQLPMPNNLEVAGWKLEVDTSVDTLSLVLRHEISGRAGNAVFVRPAVRLRNLEEIAVGGRRGSRPLDRRGLPGVVVGLLAFPDAPEEV